MPRLSSHWLAVPLGVAGLAACAHAPVASPVAPTSGPPFREEGLASFYADDLAGHLTANGERYRPAALTAAHRHLPFGTSVRVTARESGRSVVVRINNRGPFVAGRIIDLSHEAARQIGLVARGVLQVTVEALPDPSPDKSLTRGPGLM